jgi:hypothetical protein
VDLDAYVREVLPSAVSGRQVISASR